MECSVMSFLLLTFGLFLVWGYHALSSDEHFICTCLLVVKTLISVDLPADGGDGGLAPLAPGCRWSCLLWIRDCVFYLMLEKDAVFLGKSLPSGDFFPLISSLLCLRSRKHKVLQFFTFLAISLHAFPCAYPSLSQLCFFSSAPSLDASVPYPSRPNSKHRLP